jgi:hypothetical protein
MFPGLLKKSEEGLKDEGTAATAIPNRSGGGF